MTKDMVGREIARNDKGYSRKKGRKQKEGS
jgi:hypothetical protein